MNVKDTGEGPCRLLFVSRNNLPHIVSAVAPDLVLVNKSTFEGIAVSMLECVEAVTNKRDPGGV